jgi:GT2 family glycosyltransferase
MKILYVKSNSERAKAFQLRTVIFEEDGVRYVKKEAMLPEAVPHLKKMKESYRKLQEVIVDPRLKPVEIVAEDEVSLTFEYIDGTSFERQYSLAKRESEEAARKLLDSYDELLYHGFKTSAFEASYVTETFKSLFGDLDFSPLYGQPCYEGISNIDLILSNLIVKENTIYIIDYEWIFDINIPVSFTRFRTIHEANDLFWEMENNFVFGTVVGEEGFLKIQKQYQHPRIDGLGDLRAKEQTIRELNLAIETKEKIIEDKEVHIRDMASLHEKIVYDKDVHIQNQDKLIENKNIHIQNQDELLQFREKQIAELYEIVESMRLKNRAKRLVKKVLPAPLFHLLKQVKQKIRPPFALPQETPPPPPAENIYRYTEPALTPQIEAQIEAFDTKPVISIIMPVYNVDPQWLELAINSIRSQWYPHWELCMVDDKSTHSRTVDYLKAIDHPQIKVRFLEENLNISGASNAALEMTTGTYIALMDNDDELTPDALYEVVKAINLYGADFIYSDEDKIEMDGSFSDPHFKPDFCEDLFLSQNYMSHLGVIRKDLITRVEGFTIGLEGSQDYDLYLKVLEHTDKIHHIDKVLYHWRKIPGSTAAEYGEKSYAQEAGRKALENAMERRGIDATVKNGKTPGTYKVDYTLTSYPLVSIVIPFKDKPELLTTCIESIIEKTTYRNFEIIGISNNSEEAETFREMERLALLDERIAFYEFNVPFNYSRINNHAVTTYAKGEHILFLNNDIEVITPTWIEEMLMYSQQTKSGAVGAKLYFPNDTIQHAGLIMVPKTIHSVILIYQGYPKEHYGYISKLQCVNNYAAVTAACLMLKRSVFDEVGGFDEEEQSIAYNDVDLCLKLYEHGYRNIWTPYCELYHHESVSRGYEVKVKDVERREKEKWHLKEKHPRFFKKGDPFYNRNLTRFGVGCELADSVTIHRPSVEGTPFYEEILIHQQTGEQKHDTVTLFSHFDAEDRIGSDVRFYLESLSRFSDIVFVSTAENLSEETLRSIEPLCMEIIVKRNIGYDFGAWKSGFDHLNERLDHYQNLILCNDSVYGPMFDLKEIFDKMCSLDLWAMTDNYEIEYHLQSYFMVYSRKAFTHPTFRRFWENFKIYENKQALIEHNEIGFSQEMMQSGLKYDVYYSVHDRHYVNVLQYYWDVLIEEYRFPFIKKEVLKRNPLHLQIAHWEEVVSEHTDYDPSLIKENL